MFESDKPAYMALSIQEQRVIGEINGLVSAVYYGLGKERWEELRVEANRFISYLEENLPC